MKKYIALLLAVCLLLAGCGQSGEDSADQGEMPISVIAILKANNSLHWQFVDEGLEQTSKQYNIELNVLWPEKETDVDTQIRILQDAILMKPDVIIWAPDDSEHAGEYAKQIQEAGIRLIYVDENARDQSEVPFVGSDNYHAGELAAESLKEVLGEGDEIAFIGGSQEQQAHFLRYSGFREIIEKETGFRFMTMEEVPDCSISGGKTAMKKILQEYPDIKGVFCSSALLCMGAQEACQAVDRMDVRLVGMDTQSDVLTALKTGRIHAIISQSGYEMGCKAIELAVEQSKGEEIPTLNYIKNEIISRENVNDYLDSFVMEGRE